MSPASEQVLNNICSAEVLSQTKELDERELTRDETAVLMADVDARVGTWLEDLDSDTENMEAPPEARKSESVGSFQSVGEGLSLHDGTVHDEAVLADRRIRRSGWKGVLRSDQIALATRVQNESPWIDTPPCFKSWETQNL